MTQNELDVAWAAGFFDGEGSVSIRTIPYGPAHDRRRHYGVYLRASQVDRSPLDKFVALFGTGSVRWSRAYQVNHCAYYDWCCAGSSAAMILARLLPYLTVKRERALLALEFYQHCKTTGRRLTEDEKALRKTYYDRMKHLNLRQLPRTAAETKSSGSLTETSTGSDSPVCTDDKGAERGRNDRVRRLKIVGE